VKNNRIAVVVAILLATGLPVMSRVRFAAATGLTNQQPDKEHRTDDRPIARSQKPAGQSTDKLKLEAKLVNVTVTVSDPYGRFVTGLTKDNFEVFDDGVKQDIAHFTDDDAPISMGIIFDVSGSMGGLTTRSIAALQRFFETSHEDDEFFIVAFNSRAQLVQDYTTSISEILNRVVFVKAKGSTSLYDAVYLGIEKARQGRQAKRALLVISDGEENSSRYTSAELAKLLKESDVPIYAVGISETYAGAGTLRQLADFSGGHAFFPMDELQMVDIYTRISVMLRHQYVVGFYPTDSSSSARSHKVRLKLLAPKGLGRLSLFYKNTYQSFQ
jgi:Ca-activated chloride channel family protein